MEITPKQSVFGGNFFLLVVVAVFCGRYAQNRRPNCKTKKVFFA